MRVLSYNLLRDATITTSSGNELFPEANLFDKRRIRDFRFTGYTSEYVVIYNAGMCFNTLVLDTHNLTDSAVVKFQANATDTWTSPAIDVTVSVKQTIAYLWDTSQSYDYVRIYIEDPTNTEQISIGMVFLDNGYDFEILQGWNETKNILGRVSYRGLSGQFYPLERTEKENLDTIFGNSEGIVSLSVTRQQFGTAWPGYIIIDPDDLDILPLYAIIGESITLTRTDGLPEIWNAEFSAEEVF